MRSRLSGAKQRLLAVLLLLFTVTSVTAGCGGADETQKAAASGRPGNATLVIGAYSVVKDAMAEIIPRFQAKWEAETGQKVEFQQSYEASGTQARAIAGGFAADVALLAMEGDVQKLVSAGLVSPQWKERKYGGMVTRSIVVLGTRAGNPLGITDFTDLTKPGVKVLYPNPQTSGGAQWDINAIYGAGLKMSEEQGHKDPAVAKRFLAAVHRNVESLDKSGRASMAAFEYGVGDVIVTYENELLARIAKGIKYEVVIPKHTILIENPAAVIDKNVDKHGNRKLAEAFVDFLKSEEAQRIFAKNGFRPVDEKVLHEVQSSFPQPSGLFDIHYLGGWKKVKDELYSRRGVWYQVLAGL